MIFISRYYLLISILLMVMFIVIGLIMLKKNKMKGGRWYFLIGMILCLLITYSDGLFTKSYEKKDVLTECTVISTDFVKPTQKSMTIQLPNREEVKIILDDAEKMESYRAGDTIDLTVHHSYNYFGVELQQYLINTWTFNQ